MAAKDIIRKTLLSFNDIFADIVNGLLFKGEDVVQAEDLEPFPLDAVCKADQKPWEKDGVETKCWRGQCAIRIVLLGIENQTQADRDIPFRVMGYDGTVYQAQIDLENGKDGQCRSNRNPRYGVITLVLYFGYRERWNEAKTLHENIGSASKKLLPFVNDYRVNLFEIAWLSDEQAACFKSDFRFIVDYFRQMRESGDYVPSIEGITHGYEVSQLISVLTKTANQ